MQKYFPHLLIFLLVILGGGTYVATHPAPRSISAAQPSPVVSSGLDEPPIASVPTHQCDSSYAAHTYHPARLAILDPCRTISGMVEVVRQEADGDEHVLLRLDPPFTSLVNATNISQQKGDLVIEPQCVLAVTQSDAIGPCGGSPIPPGLQLIVVGAHIRVTGPYVTDLQHGWNEIHPVEWVEPN